MGKSLRAVIVVLGVAGILAILAFAVRLRTGRGDQAQIGEDIAQTVIIEDRAIVLEPDPALQVQLAGESAAAQVPDTALQDSNGAPSADAAAAAVATAAAEAAAAAADASAQQSEPTADGQAAADTAAATPTTDQAQQAAQADPTATPDLVVRPDPIITTEHRVAEGDTLYSIADRHNTSVSLMAEYNISQANLETGAILQIPVANPAYCVGYREAYIVRENDTAFSIARRFNIDYTALKAPNDLNDQYLIQAGQVLCIP